MKFSPYGSPIAPVFTGESFIPKFYWAPQRAPNKPFSGFKNPGQVVHT